MVVTKAERGVVRIFLILPLSQVTQLTDWLWFSMVQLLTDQMMLKLYAKEVETLQAKISAVEDGDLVKARDSAMAKVDELQDRSRKVRHFGFPELYSPADPLSCRPKTPSLRKSSS